MNSDPQASPAAATAIVTSDQIEKALLSDEAVRSVDEASKQDQTISDVEKAAIMAAVGAVLERIRKQEQDAGAKVLTTPPDARASRLQSLVASGEASNLKLQALSSGGYEAVFDTSDWFGWASVVWEKLKHPTPHAMVRPPNAIAQTFPDVARVAVLGDWGTGLYGAPKIAERVRHDPDPYALLLHLGDVYYSGTASEVKDRFLDMWPYRKEALNRAINSNHEMYSGGDAYFDATLPAFQQAGSYFAFQNKNWTLVGLDVAYKDHAIDDQQVDWLTKVLASAGDRKVVFFSHHQLFSNLEAEQGSKLWSHPTFGPILRSKRVFAWYWGHEHRCTIYDAPDPTFGILGRCIGHSGMPQSRTATLYLPHAKGAAFQRADWRVCDATTAGGYHLPSAVVLEGRNDLIPGEEEKFSPHGYAVLTFDGPHLIEQVLNPSGQVIYERTLC